MNEIAEILKQQYQDRINGDLESCTIEELGGKKIFWKPLTGKQQKIIQKASERSTAEGICTHVKNRAIDKDGEYIFKDYTIVGLMNDFDFEILSRIFFSMTGVDLTIDDIEGN